MYMKGLVFILILMQACGPLSAQTDSPGILQRLAEKTRDAKDKVQGFGGTVLDFFRAYYEDHMQPVTDSYVEWASDIKSSVVEKIKTTIGSYMPLKETNPTPQPTLH